MADILLLASFILLLVCSIILLFCPQVMEKPIFLILLIILVFAPLIFALNNSILVKNVNHHKQTDREKLEKYIKNKKEHKHKTYSL